MASSSSQSVFNDLMKVDDSVLGGEKSDPNPRKTIHPGKWISYSFKYEIIEYNDNSPTILIGVIKKYKQQLLINLT